MPQPPRAIVSLKPGSTRRLTARPPSHTRCEMKLIQHAAWDRWWEGSAELEVVIEGVYDVRVANEIKRKVRQVCKSTERSGQWSVMVSPSETRGQWDLGVRGPFGRHFASFTERADQLPELVAEQLRACL